MATKKVIVEFVLDDIEGYDWLFYPTKTDSEIVTDDTIPEAAKALKASPELVKAIHEAFKFLAAEIVSRAKEDIRDLLDKLDKLEKEK